MASSAPPKKNTAFSFEMSLEATAGGSFVINPTLAAGDVKVSKDGGALANITTLPTAIGAGDVITVALSATEMNADRVVVAFRDVAGAEWLACNAGPILTAAQTLDEMDTVLDSVLVDTAEIGAAGAGLTNINLPNQTMDITGNITGNLSGSVGSVTGLTVSDVGAIKAKTDNLPSDPADASVISGRFDTLDTSVADLPTNAELATALAAADDAVLAAITALNNLSAAQVNAEVVDALNVDTYAEPVQGVPGATISLAAKIGFLYKAWRNKKTVTATTHSLFNDDAATVDHKSTVSDAAGTFTETEKTTGP